MKNQRQETNRQAIADTVRSTLARYTREGRVKCAYDVGSGECEIFAEDVLAALGSPAGLDVIEYANLTGCDDGEVCNEIFDDKTLRKFGVHLPDGVSTEDLNKYGLGSVGTHVFLRWTIPAGYVWFDAEAPDGVDSPFNLPFARRYLA